MEDEELEPVNCAAAVRAIKDAGIFMLLDRDGCHYLVTEEFILQLRKKDAWKIQCKTETERRNVYYVKKKGGMGRVTEGCKPGCCPSAVRVLYQPGGKPWRAIGGDGHHHHEPRGNPDGWCPVCWRNGVCAGER